MALCRDSPKLANHHHALPGFRPEGIDKTPAVRKYYTPSGRRHSSSAAVTSNLPATKAEARCDVERASNAQEMKTPHGSQLCLQSAVG